MRLFESPRTGSQLWSKLTIRLNDYVVIPSRGDAGSSCSSSNEAPAEKKFESDPDQADFEGSTVDGNGKGKSKAGAEIDEGDEEAGSIFGLHNL